MQLMQDSEVKPKVLILGMGGTIAGTLADQHKPQHYKAGTKCLAGLLQELGEGEACIHYFLQDICQIDSKDTTWSDWHKLLQALISAMHDEQVSAVVVTHGSDTLEETAFFLASLCPWSKPVFFVFSMYPVAAVGSDAPSQFRRALQWSHMYKLPGIYVVQGDDLLAGHSIQKLYADHVPAFTGEIVAKWDMATVQMHSVGQVKYYFESELSLACALEWLISYPWPRVEVIWNHVNADALIVQEWLQLLPSSPRPVDGIVVAATGAGTLSSSLQLQLERCRQVQIPVWISTRCAFGWTCPSKVEQQQFPWGNFTALNPVKARLALTVTLLLERRSALFHQLE